MRAARKMVLQVALAVLVHHNLAITVHNTEPKIDVTGEIVDAHDGTYRKFGQFWYYHGAEYGLCPEPPKLGCDGGSTHGCGFHGNHNVSIWRSPDLSSGSWERVGTAAHCATNVPDCGILYRPHLVQHPVTGEFVLYVNYVRSDGGYGGNAVFTAPSPEGPFVLRNPVMSLGRLCPGPSASAPCGEAQGGAGDYDVFIDPKDGQGYIVYGANYYMSVEKLTPDLLNSTGENATWLGGSFGGTVAPDYFVEAPVMFERDGLYYILYGHCCCFCYQGSGIMVLTAPSPMGPWAAQPGGDLSCVEPPAQQLDSLGLRGEPTPGQGCLYGGSTEVSATRAQQNFVIQIPADGSGEDEYVWTGDRWQQSPDGLKGHEGQFWAPLEFDEAGAIAPVRWLDNFTVAA